MIVCCSRCYIATLLLLKRSSYCAAADEDGQLRVVFTQIDPREAGRKFSFSVEVQEDGCYTGGWGPGSGWPCACPFLLSPMRVFVEC